MHERPPGSQTGESADPAAGAPRWPRDRWISPTALKNFRTCPKRARLYYVDGVEAPWAYQVHLRKGTIAHNILRDIAYLLRGHRPLIDNDEILKRAMVRLPVELFPSPLARDAHARDIVRWVAYAVRYLERIPAPEWLLIEQNQHREHRVFQGVQPYTLMARPDVVIQRGDEDGEPLIEIIDYKTGKVRPEPDPPVLMRFVARDLLRERFGNASAARVRFTYLWLDHADRTHIDLSVEHCNDAWPSITGQIHALVSETAWPVTPSSLCEYCPYHQNICKEEIPPDEPVP